MIPLIYGRRWLTFGLLMALTLFLGFHALKLRPDAGFEKQIPLDHPYMKVFKKYEQAFGGANLISVALMRKDGKDIYDADFLDKLKKLTDATFFLPGVDRAHVTSLFTPDLTYLEIVEDGINLGTVIPANYAPTPEMISKVREHVGKADAVIGRFVSLNQQGAMVVASLLERHPVTGERLDYDRLAGQLEDQLRGRIQSQQEYQYKLKADRPPYKAGDVVWTGYTDYGWKLGWQTFEAAQRDDDGQAILVSGRDVTVSAQPNPDYSPEYAVRIIGFAKVIGDVTDASIEVIGFFFVAMLLVILLLWLFCGSFRLSLLPLSAAVTAVVWELGLLQLCGFGLDPFAILVPFLIMSIGVSHGVQYINAWGNEVCENGVNAFDASVSSFRRLFLPGTVAIVTNVIGFATLTFIHIDIVREMAINAALGMAAVIVTNKMMLPIVLTWVRLPDIEKFKQRMATRDRWGDQLWRRVAAITEPRWAILTLGIVAATLAWAIWMYPRLIIGDTQAGVPELKADSRYNQDSNAIVANFAIGVDILKVIAEAKPYGCLNGNVIDTVDRFNWRMQNTPGVLSAISLPVLARQARSLWSEGSPKWAVLPRNQAALSQLTGRIPSGTGLQNADCSAMPVLIFTTDHRAETLSGIVDAVKRYNLDNLSNGVNFALASGNVGVMAATNEEIESREILVILWVHLTLLVFVWISFRSWASVVCIITPLVSCSLLTYGFMAMMGIGMKSATLPVAAFGVGIGVDDGIYLWGALTRYLGQGDSIREAFRHALRAAGKATTFTSLALIVSVGTWLFSGLQFQADMGLLLLFMFTTNLFGAILMMPALGWLCHLVSPLQSKSGLLVK
ncbi:efflux RND transporter permease subunit [Nevskia soli]|uniref:efflux RND transporter permease subunit n=1 Tax=Nevskia soli TaxID=418856 RepID=UPI00068B96C2|nr:MMPL family transporter [Nevskia soli]